MYSLPKPGYTLLFRWSTAMLAIGAIRHAGLAVLVENELIRAHAFEGGNARLAVALEEIGACRWRNQTQVRASSVVLGTRICVR